jgi:dienelactone hydrolase
LKLDRPSRLPDESLYHRQTRPGSHVADLVVSAFSQYPARVARIKTPVLIFVGEVPRQESKELAVALKAAGKTLNYITWPSEGHEFQRRQYRQDADERELALLDKYPKPAAAQ